MACDRSSAANYADRIAAPKSVGRRAEYVRKAIEWGGIALQRTNSAKDYGRILEESGFREALGSKDKVDVLVFMKRQDRIWKITKGEDISDCR